MYYLITLPGLKSPVKNEFTYQSTSPLSIGDLVQVPLKSKTYLGIVLEKSKKPRFACREINQILYKEFLTPKHIQTAKFISQYYFASLAQSINLYIPPSIETPKSLKMLSENLCSEIQEEELVKLNTLTEIQESTFQNILEETNKMHMIHGVTGSGKTEIYLHLAKKYIEEGKQVLILLPEISLTPQIQKKFTQHFGKDNVVIYNSSLNKTEKLQAFLDIRNNNKKIAIGARSSLFLPFVNLGLIVMDEEHDHAYKQENNPKYHARSVFQYLVKQNNALGVIGSATPSLESFNASQQDIIKYHRIDKKAFEQADPQISIVDMAQEIRVGNYPISYKLHQEIENALANKKQAIILCNKRGFASYMQCRDCGHVEKCPHCDVSLTYHKIPKISLQCHYCDYRIVPANSCKECGSTSFLDKGVGIQQILEELNKFFPKANIERVDSDSMSKKNSYHILHKKLENKEIDIIVGTQIVATGLSFEDVSVVGVINIDSSINFPDFRSTEKTLFLLNQITGRTNRKHSDGKVIIQSFNPNEPILHEFTDKTLIHFYKSELKHRKNFNYPPFARITLLTHRHKQISKQDKEIDRIEKILDSQKIKYKSAPALIYKKNNYYNHHILINSLSPNQIIAKLNLNKDWHINRDPLTTI